VSRGELTWRSSPDVARQPRRADGGARGARERRAEAGNAHAGHAHDHPAATMDVGEALLAITVHVGGMLAVITLLVYEKPGLNVPPPGVDQLRPVLGRRVHRRRHGDAADVKMYAIWIDVDMRR
jgi:hypothetical protein